MYKNQNILFGKVGMNLGVVSDNYLQEYIKECPEHTMLFSQWLLYKKYITPDQEQAILQYINKNITSTNINDTQVKDDGITKQPPQTKQLSLQQPQQINRYKIISVLGQGGMGKVYKVFDPMHQKELALKVMLIGSEASTKAVARFKREANTMAILDHPGIVKAYDIGCENNQMFFTMDLVSGISLKELQLSRPMSIKKSVLFIIKVCEIMDYAHKKGVVHRDLKPSNIMVDNDKPIIMDFGLAKVTEASQELSKTGVMMGTLRYMPPEQAEGRHSQTTAQSDLYAIGTILYELLARRPIFTGKTHLMLINSIFHNQPTPLTEINSKIPEALAKICNKAIEKQQKNRYQSCHTFAKDLKKFLNSKQKTPPQTKNTPIYIAAIIILTCAMLFFMFSGSPSSTEQQTKNTAQNTASQNKEANVEQKHTTPFDQEVWNNCWLTDQEIFDFTKQQWLQLSVEKKLQYARLYQKWYAKHKNLPLTLHHGMAKIHLVLIPPGRFWKGSTKRERSRYLDLLNNERQRVVGEVWEIKTISKPFWIGKYEVTKAEWFAAQNIRDIKDKNTPISGVNWQQAVDFCKNLDARLPLELEWEYACRAGTNSAYNTGEKLSANYKKRLNYPVMGGQFAANAWGGYDFHGNVWEWCMDKHPNTRRGIFRFVRGGSWKDNEAECRSAYRIAWRQEKRNEAIGFRIIKEP